mmetsp:Transcript_19275/g.36920  ORF Transcript_19275/g.36920 Transcript_19275/m.36920 type:complete len:376 (+) Transcript_19275:506-1633(+)
MLHEGAAHVVREVGRQQLQLVKLGLAVFKVQARHRRQRHCLLRELRDVVEEGAHLLRVRRLGVHVSVHVDVGVAVEDERGNAGDSVVHAVIHPHDAVPNALRGLLEATLHPRNLRVEGEPAAARLRRHHHALGRDELTGSKLVLRKVQLAVRLEPGLVLLVQRRQIVQAHRALFVAPPPIEPGVAGVGLGAQVDEPVGHELRVALHHMIKPLVVYGHLHIVHPVGLVDGVDKHLSVAEDGALHDAQRRGVLARLLLLQEAREKHPVLEGVGVSLRGAVELVQQVEAGGLPRLGASHHVLPLLYGLGHHVHHALQRLALRGDAAQERRLAHADVALHAKRQPPRGSGGGLRVLHLVVQEGGDGVLVAGVAHTHCVL